MKKSLSVEDSEIIEKYVKKFLGKKNNPLNGLTFKEILDLAKQEIKEENEKV